MVLHPHVQVRARAELDALLFSKDTEQGRLPDFPDRKHTPYLNAIVSEVLRWNPVTPLGPPAGPLLCC